MKNIFKIEWHKASLQVNNLTIVLSLFFVGITSYAQTADSLFVSANKLYQQEKYQEALPLYQKIENQDMVSGALYYNMANIYYKTNQVANAIYYYEKALQLEPNNKDYQFNLAFAKRMTLDNIEVLPKSIGQKFRDNLILKFTYNTWAIAAVSLAILFAILFLLYHFSYRTGKKRFYFITSILSVIFVTLSVFFAYKNYNYQQNTQYAIVFGRTVKVNSAPSNSGEVNFELHEGTKVLVLESLDDWKKIKIADGKTGWLKAEKIKEL